MTTKTTNFPSGAIVNGHTCIERIENNYKFDDGLGNGIAHCAEWQTLKDCFNHLVGFIGKENFAPSDGWYSMNLGDKFVPDNNTMIVRVPGGWVHLNTNGSCFIPYDNRDDNRPKNVSNENDINF